MNFDPMPRVLRGQKEVNEYLASHGVRLPSKIEVEWCSPETDITISPPTGYVYFHPQILALGVKLHLTPFARDVLAHFKVPPSQLTPGCQTVLGFEALCSVFASATYGVEEFCVIYVMRKSHQDAHSLVSWSECDGVNATG